MVGLFGKLCFGAISVVPGQFDLKIHNDSLFVAFRRIWGTIFHQCIVVSSVFRVRPFFGGVVDKSIIGLSLVREVLV